MNDLLALALNRAQLLGAAYADVRTLPAQEQTPAELNPGLSIKPNTLIGGM